MFSKDEIIKIFCKIDDFCKEYDLHIRTIKRLSYLEPKKSRHRTGIMYTSEVLTILIYFHLGAHKTFKHYYQQVVQCYWKDLFPVTFCRDSITLFHYSGIVP